MSHLTHTAITTFQKTIWDYFRTHERSMPWRLQKDVQDAYPILVSEYILQQTQVARVIPKYEAFLRAFPSLQSLTQAPLKDVLTLWSGLGYNRRAKYLHEAAKILVLVPQPWSREDLLACPGIGPNTAAAIRVYAYGAHETFVETNIRTVFIHHFFPEELLVPDSDIYALAQTVLPTTDSRRWHWALMDYGTYIKGTHGNASVRAKSYNRQSLFQGSRRQLRGRILKELALDSHTLSTLSQLLSDERTEAVCTELLQEGLIRRVNSRYVLG